MTQGRQETRWMLARVGLFVILWWIGAFLFAGDLGKWADDWGFQARDPATGEYQWSRVLALDPLHTRFWRPLHIHVGYLINTTLWNQDAAIHAILAVMHGMNAWLVWRMLGAMCRDQRAAVAGALLFLVYPAGHEAIFWLSTLGTSGGTLWFLLCAGAVQRLAQGRAGWATVWLHAPLLLTLGWWYEQPAACGPALGLIYLATLGDARALGGRVRIAAGIVGAAIAAGGLYAVMVLATTPADSRGGIGKITGIRELPHQIGFVSRQAWDSMTLRNFAPGAWDEGCRAMAGNWTLSVVLITALLVAGYWFANWWLVSRSGASDERREGRGQAAARTLEVIGAVGTGPAIILASMVPVIAVQGQWFASRLAYMPVLGCAVLCAALGDALLGSRRVRDNRNMESAVRVALLAGLLPAIVGGMVMLAGVQSVWHKRAQMDEGMARQLRELVPTPGAHVVFVPVEVRGWPAATGSAAFDVIGLGPFDQAWGAENFVQFAYRRSDVHGLAFGRWRERGREVVGCDAATDAGLLYNGGPLIGAPHPVDPSGRMLLPWNAVVAFRVLPGGRIRLVDKVVIEDPENPAMDRTIALGPVEGAGENDATERAGLLMGVGSGVEYFLPKCQLIGGRGVLPTERTTPSMVRVQGSSRMAYSMHPALAVLAGRSQLRMTIERSDRRRVLAMRVAMLSEDAASDGVRVSVLTESQGTWEPIAQDVVTPDRQKREGRWMVVRAELPPMSVAQQVRVSIDAGESGNPNSDWCAVTPPTLTDVERIKGRK